MLTRWKSKDKEKDKTLPREKSATLGSSSKKKRKAGREAGPLPPHLVCMAVMQDVSLFMTVLIASKVFRGG
ncbi:DASH complex subunit DAD2 [Frankliniella fusca]|uniref:DASH complex subunit DAD2 n=1 Tax=Frankliniella fusca TaxID=407009 RepID=A0AAE1GS97_9NEOP|nr:DASH complex subunit DAD2 [Frankliniella fusca]